MRLNVHMPETHHHPRCQPGCGPVTRDNRATGPRHTRRGTAR